MIQAEHFLVLITNPTLTAAGWIGRQAILMTGINAIIYLLSTLPPYVSSYFPIVDGADYVSDGT